MLLQQEVCGMHLVNLFDLEILRVKRFRKCPQKALLNIDLSWIEKKCLSEIIRYYTFMSLYMYYFLRTSENVNKKYVKSTKFIL